MIRREAILPADFLSRYRHAGYRRAATARLATAVRWWINRLRGVSVQVRRITNEIA